MATLRAVLSFLARREANNLHIVGGAVRDRLLGRRDPDIDLSLPSDPESTARRLAEAFGASAFPIDAERGVWRVVVGGGPQIDLARYQGDTFAADLDRRDYTINALAVPLADWLRPTWRRKIVDRHDGRRDVGARRIRLVKKSAIREDPLRILRAFRQAAELGFSIDHATLDAIRKGRRGLAAVSPERIRDEMLKMFATPNTHEQIVSMDAVGIWDVLMPEFRALRRTAHAYYGPQGVLAHTFDTVRDIEEILAKLKTWFPRVHAKVRRYVDAPAGAYPRRAQLKWAGLLHDIGKPATAKVIDGRMRFFEHEHVGADIVAGMGSRFRWSTEETRRYARLVRNHMRAGNLAAQGDLTDRAIHRFFRDLGDDAIAMLLVSLGDHLTYLTPAQRRRRATPHERLTIRMVNAYYTRRQKVLPPKLVNGNDVMKAFGLKPSKLVGTLLKELEDAQSGGEVKTREEALAFLKTRVPKEGAPS